MQASPGANTFAISLVPQGQGPLVPSANMMLGAQANTGWGQPSQQMKAYKPATTHTVQVTNQLGSAIPGANQLGSTVPVASALGSQMKVQQLTNQQAAAVAAMTSQPSFQVR